DQAEIVFVPLRENNPKRRTDMTVGTAYPVFSQPDGSYQLVVPPQPGHLFCTVLGGDFLHQVINRSELMTGKPDGDKRLFDGRSGAERLYYHAIVPLDLAKPSLTKELPLTLRRGITVTGRVLGPDGKGIPRGFLFCSGELLPAQKNVLELPYALGEHLSGAVRIENGRFELRGCDPDKNYRLFFFEDIGKPGKEPGHAVINTPFAL